MSKPEIYIGSKTVDELVAVEERFQQACYTAIKLFYPKRHAIYFKDQYYESITLAISGIRTTKRKIKALRDHEERAILDLTKEK
jgi:hypothetical protein